MQSTFKFNQLVVVAPLIWHSMRYLTTTVVALNAFFFNPVERPELCNLQLS